MKRIVESHGGTVEKFIGDAVMAVFGVPVTHEDDALRASGPPRRCAQRCRELRHLSGRIGVNTGEVVTGTVGAARHRETQSTPPPASSRRQRPVTSLSGAATMELVRAAVEAEPADPLTLKGKAEPVAAYRLVSVLRVPERSHETRFVGRDRELQHIRARLGAGPTPEATCESWSPSSARQGWASPGW